MAETGRGHHWWHGMAHHAEPAKHHGRRHGRPHVRGAVHWRHWGHHSPWARAKPAAMVHAPGEAGARPIEARARGRGAGVGRGRGRARGARRGRAWHAGRTAPGAASAVALMMVAGATAAPGWGTGGWRGVVVMVMPATGTLSLRGRGRRRRGQHGGRAASALVGAGAAAALTGSTVVVRGHDGEVRRSGRMGLTAMERIGLGSVLSEKQNGRVPFTLLSVLPWRGGRAIAHAWLNGRRRHGPEACVHG